MVKYEFDDEDDEFSLLLVLLLLPCQALPVNFVFLAPLPAAEMHLAEEIKDDDDGIIVASLVRRRSMLYNISLIQMYFT